MGSNSANKAKERLSRITFKDWLDRVDMLLSLDGKQSKDFPELYWRGYYGAGMSPGHVAEVVMAVNRQTRRRPEKTTV